MVFDFDFKDFGYLVAVDAAVVLLFAAVMFFFFKKRRNLRVFLLFLAVSILYVAFWFMDIVTVGYAFSVAKLACALFLVFFIAATAVVYQSDLKVTFMKFSSRFKKGVSFASSDDDLRTAAAEIVKACQNLSKNDIGALIVIAPDVVPEHILSTGTEIGALVTYGLLESIFTKLSPLHDGAVMVKENRIVAAGCFLPLSENTSLSKELGTRHRAALGITEETDVLAIVVSEQTGVISVARRGKFKRYMTPEKLLDEIQSAFGIAYAGKLKDDEFDI
jgi:diadenylate cyclase